ncbi:hypothetical protein [Poseidonibacter ostreae]|uniref:Uncharacterized protein n=1 Tax=Poseidonibacter ostreae TaxID=2654171 RepID=A0A6L4WZD5_9BACT|nr:hypothetical protein [Poseidonibacter ostreae]KAB7891374.1 hypothetical protein GBG19_00630 [Poseidonibacter ostreae]
MSSNIIEIAKFLKKFDDAINIHVLEDNAHHVDSYVMKKEVFLEQLSDKEYEYNGISTSEFYVVDEYDHEYTFQISSFDFDLELDF